jgi:mono/diheme cytochrome c family protein
VLVEADEKLADQVEAILKTNGAHHFRRIEEKGPMFKRRSNAWNAFKARLITALRGPDPGHRSFWLSLLGIVIVLGAVTTLLAYDIIPLSFPTQMENQVSIAYEQAPRLAAPAAAVPVQGPVLLAGQPASEPVTVSPDSLQRGKVLFGITCIICHGERGAGNGKLSGFFQPKPADLSSAPIQSLSESSIFLAITEGLGVMPSLAENLGVQDRWDVINYVRSLKK